MEELIPDFKERGMDLTLIRMEKVIEKLNLTKLKIPAIQIAGTNGKGSIISFLESSLIQEKVNIGVTTSPHLRNWEERIRINGKNISSKKLKKELLEIKELSKTLKLTTFEYLIATAIKHFISNKVDLIILEVGLGGRLDATTSYPFRPIIGFASIGKDHCDQLGNTLSDIAKEKAAIITKGCTIVSGFQAPEVAKVIEIESKKKNAIIKWVSALDESWKLSLNGEFQKNNAAVAKCILENLYNIGIRVNKKSIINGFLEANWPGRLQKVVWKDLNIILDGAHNPHAAEQLSKERSYWNKNNNKVIWIIGIQLNKDACLILHHLVNPDDIAWIVPIPGHKSWRKDLLDKQCEYTSKQLRQGLNIPKVLKKIESDIKYEKASYTIFITGSLYLVGDLLSTFFLNRSNPSTYQD